MKNMKGITAVTLAFIGGLEVGVALMAYGVLWATESIKHELESNKPSSSRVSYRRYCDD